MSPLLRLILVASVGPILTLHFLIPLFQTFIPIWRERGSISWELAARLLVRLSLVVLILLQVIFHMEAFLPGTFNLEFLRWVRTIAWLGVGFGCVIGWVMHPAGLKGL